MNLELKIEQMLVAYAQGPTPGLQPKKMLVGRQEADHLFRKAYARTGRQFTEFSRDGNRLEYKQMAVYVVDMPSYLWYAP